VRKQVACGVGCSSVGLDAIPTAIQSGCKHHSDDHPIVELLYCELVRKGARTTTAHEVQELCQCAALQTIVLGVKFQPRISWVPV
jgi:hypothetical protein